MNSVMRFIVWGTIPIRRSSAAHSRTWVGLRQTIVVGAIGGGLAFLWILFSRSGISGRCRSPSRMRRWRPSSARRFPASATRFPRPTTDVRVWPRGGLWRHATSSGSGRRRPSASSARRSHSWRCRLLRSWSSTRAPSRSRFSAPSSSCRSFSSRCPRGLGRPAAESRSSSSAISDVLSRWGRSRSRTPSTR